MNPQVIYGQLNKSACEEMYERLGSYYRKIVSSDNTHKVSQQFAESLARETDIRFAEHQRLHEQFWPANSQDYLKANTN